MTSPRKTGRRKFLRRCALGAAAVTGFPLIGLTSARHTNQRLLEHIAALAKDRQVPAPLPGLHDFTGVIHVHSRLSKDSDGAPDAEIICAAQAAGLRFVLTTDHNDRRIFTEGMQGKYGDILVIRGAEMIKEGQSLLAINIKEYIDGHQMTIQQAVDAIKAQGGLAFVAHPWRFKEWDVIGLDGMEIYDLADSTYANLWKAPVMLADFLSFDKDLPEEILVRGPLSRPDYDLSKWDTLTRKRRLVGIAGNDAHQNTKIFGRLIDPYALDFKFVQVHILATAFDETYLLQALQAGHSYSSFGLLSDATGFQFLARSAEILGIMGDAVAFSSRPILTVRAPHAGLIRLYRAGRVVAEANASELEFAVPDTGAYRVEVSLPIDGQEYPWIFSNPIYVV